MSYKSVKARLDAATPGPWGLAMRGKDPHNYKWAVVETDGEGDMTITKIADAELVAHAPIDIALMLRLVRVTRVDHWHTTRNRHPYCGCGRRDETDLCPYLAALDALEATP